MTLLNKLISIIDIGSNSASISIYKIINSSKFETIFKLKQQTKMSKDSYQNDGVLQNNPLEITYNAISEFTTVANDMGVDIQYAIATSAMRDAPNAKNFTNRVKKGIGISIDIISGIDEATLGGLAVIHKSNINNGVVVDIGGGSTDLSLIIDSVVVQSYSLKLGVIRLQEYKDNGKNIDNIIDFELKKIPDSIYSPTIIGIGGTLRAISKYYIKDTSSYHQDGYNPKKYKKILNKILKNKVDINRLSYIGDKSDMIYYGAKIFLSIIKKIDSDNIQTSKANIKDGFLLNLLSADKIINNS
jgi:exopolyphosphatase/guanosine-5'-triphosphate,3'-diphosphate pyrophosphatase